jgi:lipopolysaccharide transport system ATP-binding protein
VSDPAITVEGLSKAYRIGLREEASETLVGAAAALAKAPLANLRKLRRLNTFSAAAEGESDDLVWALKDVSFQVERGEVVGVIGKNGAGKSTLLKILSRITEPTAGRAVVRGRVSSLLEVGTGFHPELTGRENVYMNGVILGMKKREIDAKFDEIVEFSGIEKFLDTPIKRYSSGMKVRLAFAVAAHLEPEILIIDEVLAVGDQEFQNKCLGKMQNVATSGRTILFVSHNMRAMQHLCNRGVYLAHGCMQYLGDIGSTIDAYLEGVRRNTSSADLTGAEFERDGDGSAKLEFAAVCDSQDRPADDIAMGEGITVRVRLRSLRPRLCVGVAVGVFNNLGMRVCGFNSMNTARFGIDVSEQEVATATLKVPSLNLVEGAYWLSIALYDARTRQIFDRVVQAVSFRIIPVDIYETGRISNGEAIVFYYPEWALESVHQPQA